MGSNKRNGLWMRVCGGFVCYVIKLIEKKRAVPFLVPADAKGTALAESLVFPVSPKNHANILTLSTFPLKSRT
jgi:hypothetical protein